MKKDAVVKLNRILQETTGVSLFQCEKEVVHLQMNGLIKFPTYVYRTMLLPVALLLGLVIVGSFAFVAAEFYAFAVLFLILGSASALMAGLSIGALMFIHKWSFELKEMLAEVLKQVKFVLMEISIADEDNLETYLDIPPLEDVIRGMSQIMCFAVLEKQIQKQLPYLSQTIFHIIQIIYRSLLDEIANRIYSFSSEAHPTEQPSHATGEIDTHILYSSQGLRILDILLRDTTDLIKYAKRGIVLSIKLIGFFTCGFLGLIIGIIYLLLA
jgi:hypothetical protein